MKAAPLLVAWHDEKAPIYSVHFQTHGKGRLATAGGDNNIRLWNIETKGDERNVTYLATLSKHQQAVNVVRWSPRDEILASAGDDGNVLIWAKSDIHNPSKFGEEDEDAKETWMVRTMCRSNARPDLGIYDLAWSPDGRFFVTGSTDNVARIFDASNGTVVRQIAEHNHYVQGVSWDPLNEYIATQSSDRSVHVYKLETTDGHSTLEQPSLHSRISRMDLPAKRVSSSSPAPPEFGHRASLGAIDNHLQPPNLSPAPSAPGTPKSAALPMNPHTTSHHRSTSGTNASPSIHRSQSPAPSMPLPAVMPSASPSLAAGLGVKNYNIYANETLTSFFRRLTFAPDGSLLFTPAGQYKNVRQLGSEPAKGAEDVINTVYIYSRGGLDKPPVAHLPGHKRPSIAVRCSPVRYNLRLSAPTRNITIDTSSTADDIAPLPAPLVPSKTSAPTTMYPPPITGVPTPAPSTSAPSPRPHDAEPRHMSDGPQPAFALPYRIVYAVATQDAVYVYDTQQQTPLCIVSNLHFATFTDLCWSNDGLTLLMSSSDGFCSALSFAVGELGSSYQGPPLTKTRPSAMNLVGSNSSTTQHPPAELPANMSRGRSSSGFHSPSPMNSARPPSPTRSESASSVATQSSFAHPSGVVISNPTPSVSKVPSVAATGSSALPSPTPPLTPLHHSSAHTPSAGASFASSAGPSTSVLPAKREGETIAGREEAGEEGHEPKRRRIAPTVVSVDSEKAKKPERDS